MSEKEIRNSRIESEFLNPAYDIINEAINYTAKKYEYKEYDLVKLVMMIYKENYRYISNDNEYRDEFRLLDEYFKKEYNHSIITFIMLKTIVNLKNSEIYENIMDEIISIEKILRTSKEEELYVLPTLIERKKYNEIMYLIERNISLKYAVAIVYDRIKTLK